MSDLILVDGLVVLIKVRLIEKIIIRQVKIWLEANRNLQHLFAINQ